jgi:hypothetical protein
MEEEDAVMEAILDLLHPDPWGQAEIQANRED